MGKVGIIYILYKSFWRLRDPTKTDDPKQAMFYAFRISVYFRQMEMVGGKPGICWASIFQENGGKKKEVGVKRPWVSNCPTFFLRGEYYCVFKKKEPVSWSWFFFGRFPFSLFFVGCESKLPKKNPAKQVDWWVHLMPKALFGVSLYMCICM